MRPNLLRHRSHGDPRGDEGRPEVDGHDLIIVVIIQLYHQAVARDSGVVDEDTDAAVFLDKGLECSVSCGVLVMSTHLVMTSKPACLTTSSSSAS